MHYDHLINQQIQYRAPIYGRFEKVSAINDLVYVQTLDSILTLDLKGKQSSAIPRINGLEKTIDFLFGDDQYICVTTANAVYVFEASSLNLLYQFTPKKWNCFNRL